MTDKPSLPWPSETHPIVAVEVIEQENCVRLGTLTVSSENVIARATAIAQPLAALILDRKLFHVIQGKKYVQVEGWTTLGAMLGILPRERFTRDEEDGSYTATVELVRVTDGMVVGRASALCGMDEPRWAKAPKYARRSMAVTRATGKAYRLAFSWIMKLAGYEPTPAEEMIEGEARDVPENVLEIAPTPLDVLPDDPLGWTGSRVDRAKDWLVKAKLIPEDSHPEHVRQMLQLSNLVPTAGVIDVCGWVRKYRGHRDAGKTPEEAAGLASQERKP